MTSMYGHKWTSAHGLDDANGVWAKALGGLNGQDIARGMQACLEHAMKWPPSAPEFRGMCEADPKDFGLPDEHKAYKEACAKAHPAMAPHARWSHQAVYHAACETGFYNLSNLAMEASRQIFSRNYAIAVRMVMAGEQLREIPIALPEKVDPRVTPDVGKAAIEKLRASLIKQSNPEEEKERERMERAQMNARADKILGIGDGVPGPHEESEQ